MRSVVFAVCAAVSVFVAACDAESIHAVGAPGGVYRPDQGCALAEGAPHCPAVGEGVPVLRFESTDNPGIAADTARRTLSNLKITCARSFCGTGSFVAHADLEWTADANYPQRAATFTYAFDTPLDLAGHALTFAVYVEDLTIPMHAQIGVIFQYWRWVAWSPLTSGWNQILGVVSAANPLTKIDASVTSIPVTALQIDVYVPVNTPAGTNGSWSGNIYLDDIGWR